jgi:RNA polymerase sigma-70 factor (ECF subfamily)
MSEVAIARRNRHDLAGKDRMMAVSFEEAFASEFATLHRYLRRRVGESTADELAAQTFATAYASWHRFDPSRSLRPWLYGIAANLLRHHWRSERRMLRAYARTGIDPVVADDDETVARLDADAQRRVLAAALGELRPQDREILLLHAWAELSDSEIGAALSLPTGTVKSRLHRTRERLRHHLDRQGQVAVRPSSSPAEDPR